MRSIFWFGIACFLPLLAIDAGEPTTDSATNSGGTTKLPLPDKDDQDASLVLIKDIFQEEYQTSESRVQKQKLAERLLRLAEETHDDASGRFVLFRVAKDIAVQAGDADLAHAAIHLCSELYDIDARSQRLEIYRILSTDTLGNRSKLKWVEAMKETVGECCVDDRFDEAMETLKLAQPLIDHFPRSKRTDEYRKLQQEVSTLRDEHRKVAAMTQALSNDPNDQDANLTWGTYLCFSRNRWEQGLPALVKGSDSTLSDLAKRELDVLDVCQQASNEPWGITEDLKDKFAVIADQWWIYAESPPTQLSETQRIHIREHTALWYREGVDGEKGLRRRLVEQRIQNSIGHQPAEIHQVRLTKQFRLPWHLEKEAISEEKSHPDATMQTKIPATPTELAGAPELLMPRDRVTLPQPFDGEWKFDWTDVPNAKSYEIIVIGGQASIPLVNSKVHVSQHVLQRRTGYIIDRNLKNWQWRVRAVTPKNEKGPWSEWRTFNVASRSVGSTDHVYRSITLTNARVTGGPVFVVGATVPVQYQLTNQSNQPLIVSGWMGTRQHWIERLGPDWRIPSKDKGTAKKGKWYAAAGCRVRADSRVESGKSFPYTERISTRNLPPGKYLYHIEYKKNSGDVLQTESVPFELSP